MIYECDYLPTREEKDALILCGWVELQPNVWTLPGHIDWGLCYIKARREQDLRDLWGV